MIAYCSSRAGRVAGLAAVVALGLGALTACGGGTAATVTVTNTATATVTSTVSASAAASTPASTPATSSRPAGSTTAGTSPATSAAGSTVAGSTGAGSAAPAASGVPTSAAQETILTVRIEAYDPATGTLTFVPQELVETEGSAPAVLSDPAQRGAPSTAQVTAQTNVKFLRFGTDIGAAIAAGDVYCNMVLDGSQVSYLWELYAT